MKNNFYYIFFLSLFLNAILLSCRKEKSCENCGTVPVKKPPIAKAGLDQTVSLPLDSAMLNGNGSTDPDGTITQYSWRRIDGPSNLIFTSSTAVTTVIKTLIMGVYKIELTVTDNDGLTGKDTVQIYSMDPAQPNRPPTANAGPDQVIALPVTTATLDGSGSTDPDNNISSYLWTKIGGPPGNVLSNGATMISQLTNLVVGPYQFELKVTDAVGLFSKDTMTLTVVSPGLDPCTSVRAQVDAQLVPFGRLSLARNMVTIAAAGTKILFAGGQFDNGAEYQTTNLVDIYDTVTRVWSTAYLPDPRYSMEAVTVGNKIYFAGGRNNWFDNHGWEMFSYVEIYDAGTNTWSTMQLSSSRTALSIAHVGNKLLFAGGRNEYPSLFLSNVVDILDLTTNTWTTTTLSIGRSDMASVVVGNKVFFAGGNTSVGPINGTHNPSTRIDIYDAASNTWSISNLSEPRSNLAGISYGNQLFFAGGEKYPPNVNSTLTLRVDKINLVTGVGTQACLFQPNSWFDAVVHDNKIVFFTGGGAWSSGGLEHGKFDIYDPASDSWIIGKLNLKLSHPGILSYHNSTYVAGGFLDNFAVTDQVWKLSF